MGPAALVVWRPRGEESSKRMTELLQTIQTMISSETDDLAEIERTLTDGYAHALVLEGEKLRLERRVTEIAQEMERGDTAENARELASLAKSIDGKQGALARLRAQLTELRRYAERVRVRS
jgi:septal ring factor EnvC (AmiA/AmiB activator)